ncbi:hypothetical protein [Microcoleus sp. F4-D5]
MKAKGYGKKILSQEELTVDSYDQPRKIQQTIKKNVRIRSQKIPKFKN